RGVLADDGICVQTLPTEPVAIAGAFDTDADPRCVAYSGDGGFDAYCVVAGTDVTVAGTFVGRRALVVIALGSITITDRVDLSAHHIGDAAPAGSADDSACAAGVPPNQTPFDPVWGGAGGSFGGRGGDGGRDAGQPPCTTLCTAAEPVRLTAPTALRGGCR